MASIQGTPEADTLVGGNDSDTLLGGAGADQMTGGDGNDIYYVDSVNDLVNEVGYSQRADGTWKDGGKDTVHTNLAEYTLPANVENLVMGGKNGAEPGTAEAFAGKAGVRHGVGNSERNLMQGDGGAEHFEGLDGDDTLLGGGGNDTLEGGYGWDLLDGGSGADVMNGGDSSDTYIVDDEGDVINDVSSTPDYYPYGTSGIDVMTTSLQTVSVARYKGIEEVQLIGDAALDRVVIGTSGWTKITAMDGNDLLQGMGGSDTLYGGLGNDTLAGYAVRMGEGWYQPDDSGVAMLHGGAGDDLYVLSNGGSADADSVFEYAGQGRDTVVANGLFYGVNSRYQSVNDIEVIRFSGQQAWGNALDNLIVGEGGGFQHLRGGEGNDTIQANAAGAFMDGGVGNDLLQSSSVTAKDLYQLSGLGVDVIEDAGGIDSLTLKGFSRNGLAFSHQGNDLQIIQGGALKGTVKDWFDRTGQHRIEFIVLDDGSSVSATDIDDLLANQVGATVQLPDAMWVQARDMGSARSMTDSWGSEAIRGMGNKSNSYSLEWGRYIDLFASIDEPRMLRGSSGNDVIKNLYNHVPEIWAGEGDDDITVNQVTAPKVLRVHGGTGNDTITANYGQVPLEVDLARGSGNDVVNVSGNISVTLVLSGGVSTSDLALYVIPDVDAQGNRGMDVFVKDTGDSVRFWYPAPSNVPSNYSITPYFAVTDGKEVRGIESLSRSLTPHSAVNVATETSAQSLVDGMAVFSAQASATASSSPTSNSQGSVVLVAAVA